MQQEEDHSGNRGLQILERDIGQMNMEEATDEKDKQRGQRLRWYVGKNRFSEDATDQSVVSSAPKLAFNG